MSMPHLVLPAGEAVVALGANLGDAARTLAEVRHGLPAWVGGRGLATSRLYDTEPVGPAQPRYVNAAIRLAFPGTPEQLLERLFEVERRYGRVRSPETRFGPRTLDLDLLLFGGARCASESLTLPHPRLLERAFALCPLLDVAPELAALAPRVAALGGTPRVVDWPELSPE